MQNNHLPLKKTHLKATGEFAYEKQLLRSVKRELFKLLFELEVPLKQKKAVSELYDSGIDKDNILPVAVHSNW